MRRRGSPGRGRALEALGWSLVAAAVAMFVAVGAFGTSNPLVALLQIGTWMPFQGNLILFPIMALCSIAILVYFLKPENRDGFHWFKTLVAPILGAGSIIFAVYLMLKYRGALTTGSRTGWAFDVPAKRRSSRSLTAAGGSAPRQAARQGSTPPRNWG